MRYVFGIDDCRFYINDIECYILKVYNADLTNPKALALLEGLEMAFTPLNTDDFNEAKSYVRGLVVYISVLYKDLHKEACKSGLKDSLDGVDVLCNGLYQKLCSVIESD